MSSLDSSAEIGFSNSGQAKKEGKGVIKADERRRNPAIARRREIQTRSGLVMMGLGTLGSAGLVISSAFGGSERADASGVQIVPVSPNSSHHQAVEPPQNLIVDSRVAQEKDMEIPNLKDAAKDILKVVPKGMEKDAAIAFPYLAKAFEDENLDTVNVFAYALATVEKESEFRAVMEKDAEEQAAKYNYEGGVDHAGRGFGQLTGPANYKAIGDRIGEDLLNNPDLLTEDLEVSAQSVAAFFVLNGTAKYAKNHDYIEARYTYNPGEEGNPDPLFSQTPQKIADRADIYRTELLKYVSKR